MAETLLSRPIVTSNFPLQRFERYFAAPIKRVRPDAGYVCANWGLTENIDVT